MKKWAVETRVTLRRIYTVEADNEKAAIEASCNTTADHEEDIDEETMTVTELVEPASQDSAA